MIPTVYGKMVVNAPIGVPDAIFFFLYFFSDSQPCSEVFYEGPEEWNK